MNKKEYQIYLKSVGWAKTRADIIELFGGECVRCGRNGNHVHHLTYKNVGFEEPEDLILLCEKCHMDEHDLLKPKKKKISAKKKRQRTKRQKKLDKKRKSENEIRKKMRDLEKQLEVMLAEKSEKRIKARKKKLFSENG